MKRNSHVTLVRCCFKFFFRISFLLLQDNLNNDRQRNEENLKLKENIIQSYRKQIEIRRALLELDCGLVDLFHEQSRNESVIEK